MRAADQLILKDVYNRLAEVERLLLGCSAAARTDCGDLNDSPYWLIHDAGDLVSRAVYEISKQSRNCEKNEIPAGSGHTARMKNNPPVDCTLSKGVKL